MFKIGLNGHEMENFKRSFNYCCLSYLISEHPADWIVNINVLDIMSYGFLLGYFLFHVSMFNSLNWYL